MPRLVGKQSNSGLWISVVLVMAIAAVAGASEYLGYTNFIPGWGKDRRAISQATTPITRVFSSMGTSQH
jgi:hypothetical protein